MEKKSNFFLLLLIVALLSLTLAGLAVYILIGGNQKQVDTKINENYEKTAPKDTELASIKVFGEESKYFNLKDDEKYKGSFVQLSVELKYFLKVDGLSEPFAKINLYLSDIKELIGTYFLNVALSDIKTPEGKKHTKEDLKKEINKLLLRNEEKVKTDIVYEVVLEDMLFQ